MLWDFGLNPLHMDNPAAVEGKIREIEDTFHLGKQFLFFFNFNKFFTMKLLKNVFSWFLQIYKFMPLVFKFMWLVVQT